MFVEDARGDHIDEAGCEHLFLFATCCCVKCFYVGYVTIVCKFVIKCDS